MMERERERERERQPFSFAANMGAFNNKKRRSEEDIVDADLPGQTKRITTPPPFDAQRAESSRQHVIALNTQFASWVQKQLQDHPDELWQEGVHDYLNHASDILSKFKDVVEWLRKNSVDARKTIHPNFSSGVLSQSDTNSFFSFPSKDDQKKPAPTVPSPGSWSFGLPSGNQTPANAGSSWSFGLTSSTQSSLKTGILNSSPSPQFQTGVSEGQEEDGESLEEPSSPSVKKVEEPGTVVVYEVKCKLYVKPEDPAEKWKDKGVGQLYIKCNEGAKRGSKEAKAKVEIRNDAGKLILNALLYPNIKLNLQKKTLMTIFHTAEGTDAENNVKPRTYLLRLNSEDDIKKLEEAIKGNAPSAD